MRLLKLLRRMFHAMVGAADYDAYRGHMVRHHPGQPIMDRTQFFRNRQEARYGAKGGGRCC